MHAVLQIPELVNAILQYHSVYPSGAIQPGRMPTAYSRDDLASDKEKRRTLRSVALSSKKMSRHALPILWATIEGMGPLVKLLPGIQLDKELKQWILTRSLRRDDFNRFDFFAKLVKHFIQAPRREYGYPIHPSVIFQVCIIRGGKKPLIPSLKTLCVLSSCQYAGVLLSRALKCVKILPSQPGTGSHPEAWNLLAQLPERTPLLEELHVGVSPSESNLCDIIELKQLRTLSFAPTDGPAKIDLGYLKELERLPNIRSLNLGQLRLPEKRCTESEVGFPYHLPELEDLSFVAPRGRVVDVLSKIQANTLKSLVLNIAPSNPSDDVSWESSAPGYKEILEFVAETQSLTLTKLQFTFCTGIDASWLKPLLNIHGMQEFDLGYAQCSSLTDSDIEGLASAWPRLKTFRLHSSHDAPLLTLASIQSFARHCPNLRSLSLDVIGRHIAPFSKSPLNNPDSNQLLQLKHLSVFSVSNWAPIKAEEVVFVTQYLRTTFPSLLYAFVTYVRDHTSLQAQYSNQARWSGLFSVLLPEYSWEERVALLDLFVQAH